MAENNEIVWCDGTCGLSPEEHDRQHPHPMTVLRAEMAAPSGICSRPTGPQRPPSSSLTGCSDRSRRTRR
ncbi:hypothetical protein [Actinomadura madurae]|uniref:hypothetical protein n=1 Tax=Actinomadura madurae TaxID=1993 RepID=UPI0020D24160|nr:hypothetical protein [Actinomadura madurae]MCQ0011953.1 hypothetical protein [Actinomadura madurae]